MCFCLGQSTNVKCTTNSDRCCKLGRKAARHHLISPFFTCHYEALLAGLDHQTSVANRMRLSFRGRVKYTKAIVRTTAFRSRLASCYLPRNKQCFESCCKFKKEAMIKASKHAKVKMLKKHVIATPTPKHVNTTPTAKQMQKMSPSKHVKTTPTAKHLSAGKSTGKHVEAGYSSLTNSSNHVRPATPSTKHSDLSSNHITKNITETPNI